MFYDGRFTFGGLSLNIYFNRYIRNLLSMAGTNTITKTTAMIRIRDIIVGAYTDSILNVTVILTIN